MQFLVHLKCTFVVELFGTKITDKFLLVLLHSLAVTVQLGDVGVPLQVKSEVSPAI